MAATTARVLDAADPPPRRDEARFAGDYKAFERRCAWNEDEERELCRRQKVQLQDADAADVHGAKDEMLNTRSTATRREP